VIKEKTHETCNQDFSPRDRISGHIRNGRRSPGSRLGRRLYTIVPTLDAWPVQITTNQPPITTFDIIVIGGAL